MDLLEKIEKKLGKAKACKFKTGKQLKRVHDETGSGSWDIRYDWVLYDANDKEMSHSEWIGFETLSEALMDMFKHIK